MRTTLYSRLKPEFKKIVEEKSKLYPVTGRGVVESLQKTMYHRLTIFEVTDLALFLSYYHRSDAHWWSGKDLFNTEDDIV
jgi:hypothetical protein